MMAKIINLPRAVPSHAQGGESAKAFGRRKFQAIEAAATDKSLTAFQVRVFVVLMSYANKVTWRARPSAGTLASSVHARCDRSVRDALDSLEARGYIKCVRAGGGRDSKGCGITSEWELTFRPSNLNAGSGFTLNSHSSNPEPPFQTTLNGDSYKQGIGNKEGDKVAATDKVAAVASQKKPRRQAKKYPTPESVQLDDEMYARAARRWPHIRPDELPAKLANFHRKGADYDYSNFLRAFCTWIDRDERDAVERGAPNAYAPAKIEPWKLAYDATAARGDALPPEPPMAA